MTQFTAAKHIIVQLELKRRFQVDDKRQSAARKLDSEFGEEVVEEDVDMSAKWGVLWQVLGPQQLLCCD